MDGWISINRRLQNKSWYRKSEYVHVWLHLLLNANHEDKKILIGNKEIEIKRGQLLTSRRKISEKTNVQETLVYRILKLFESVHQIEQQKTNKYTVITIVNYDKYQKNEHQIEQQMNNKRTTNEQQMNTNNNDNNVNNNIYYYLERQFGRTLAPAEYELLSSWQDWFNDDIIRLAIDKTILQGARALSYTEAIINTWHDKQFTTVEECKNENIKTEERETPEIFEYDWLNENED